MQIFIILVKPAVPENVGAAARAMKTTGFKHLRLVKPCKYLEGKARWMAHGSGEILDQAEVFNSLNEAVADLDFVIGTSAKRRSAKGDHHPAENLLKILQDKEKSVNNSGLVFGREESGLTNDELRLCDISSFIPMAGRNPSLNLSQAVMLFAYLLSGINLTSHAEKTEMADEAKYVTLKKQVAGLLENTGIEKNPNIYSRVFERLSLLGDNDVNLVMSVLAAMNEKYRSGAM